ncbi:nodulation protein NodZ [Emticicia soli]|uniref:Nodulation protein NodZ n=1 Tax=Emticicia soli TaxID=2027878 RepID=A0ABW5JBW6_9BACT
MNEFKRHIICEKDVGLFSLIQQVIAHIPFALANGAYPVAFFGNRCCYWTSNGYQAKTNVWEYYFEPLLNKPDKNIIEPELSKHLINYPPDFKSKGYFWNTETFVSNNFGHHKYFRAQALQIPYKWKDPDTLTRQKAYRIIQQYIRPRHYITQKVNHFFEAYMQNQSVVGVHIRASDVSDLKTEYNLFRRYSYSPQNYIKAIENIRKRTPNTKFFVATDSRNALNLLIEKFPGQVIYYSSIFQTSDQVTGTGAMGWKMPAYLTHDSQNAAKNGEEAIIDYLLLSKCSYLIHNGSGLARTVLLNVPDMPHQNLHSFAKYLGKVLNPLSLEIFYLGRISLQKGLWRLIAIAKKIIR